MKTIQSQVKVIVAETVETRGAQWVIGLGYAASNDYAQSVTNQLNVKFQSFYRFETVARYIRKEKNKLAAAAKIVPTI